MPTLRSKICLSMGLATAFVATVALAAKAGRNPSAAPGHASAFILSQQESVVKGEIIRLEQKAWEAIRKKDRAALASIVADDYLDFGSDGRVDKAHSISEGWMDQDTLTDFALEDVQVKLLDKDVALITYRANYRQVSKGESSTGSGFYSGTYVHRDGKWLAVFTQDSNLKCAGM
jgi:hypothetical protein